MYNSLHPLVIFNTAEAVKVYLVPQHSWVTVGVDVAHHKAVEVGGRVFDVRLVPRMRWSVVVQGRVEQQTFPYKSSLKHREDMLSIRPVEVVSGARLQPARQIAVHTWLPVIVVLWKSDLPRQWMLLSLQLETRSVCTGTGCRLQAEEDKGTEAKTYRLSGRVSTPTFRHIAHTHTHHTQMYTKYRYSPISAGVYLVFIMTLWY